MQSIYVPKYDVHYRVNPKDPTDLQWSKKVYGPATQWQHAMSFKNPIKALDIDDQTGQGVVVLNDSSTFVSSGVRVFNRKFYPAGTKIYSLYAIGESKASSDLPKSLKSKVRGAICYHYENDSCVVLRYDDVNDNAYVYLYHTDGSLIDKATFEKDYNGASEFYNQIVNDIISGK